MPVGDATFWLYLDDFGTVQGPFPHTQMKDWVARGCLFGDTLVHPFTGEGTRSFALHPRARVRVLVCVCFTVVWCVVCGSRKPRSVNILMRRCDWFPCINMRHNSVREVQVPARASLGVARVLFDPLPVTHRTDVCLPSRCVCACLPAHGASLRHFPFVFVVLRWSGGPVVRWSGGPVVRWSGGAGGGPPDPSLFCRVAELFPDGDSVFCDETADASLGRFLLMRRFVPVRAAAEGMGVDPGLAQRAVGVMVAGDMPPDVMLLLDIVQSLGAQPAPASATA